MKMSKEDYAIILKAFKTERVKVLAHYSQVKEKGQYTNLDVRVAWDCLRGLVGVAFITKQYEKGLNDNHITTACVKALKEVISK